MEGRGQCGSVGYDYVRAVTYLETALASCMLLTHMMTGLSALLHCVHGHLSPKTHFVQTNTCWALCGF